MTSPEDITSQDVYEPEQSRLAAEADVYSGYGDKRPDAPLAGDAAGMRRIGTVAIGGHAPADDLPAGRVVDGWGDGQRSDAVETQWGLTRLNQVSSVTRAIIEREEQEGFNES